MHYRGVECLNCGHPLDLTDRFCAYCGQINTTKRLSLADFFNEFVLSVFTYDSRFRYTLKDLLFKPGTITKNYAKGKRLKYANPFRFFLSASIFYFILLAIVGFFETPQEISFTDNKITVNGEEVPLNTINEDSLNLDLKSLKNITNESELNTAEEKLNQEIKAGIVSIKKSKDKKEDNTYVYISEEEIKKHNFINRLAKKGAFFHSFYETTDIKNADLALDSIHYEKTKMNLWLYSKNKDYDRIKENPVRFASYLASKTPFFLFFFAPIFALFFWIIYSKKKANYMEHLVFIFHIFSWIFVVLIICLLPDILLPGDHLLSSIIILFIGPFYFYKALRNFYKQQRLITLIKFVFLNFVFMMGASVFAFFFFAITAILF
ncbi:uncharacterized protein DUF3667 [Dokdonia sp. Hel_I_53]|nr:uncharacterized protein DUF3667 [Dokdonia sp. Hel_I_53]